MPRSAAELAVPSQVLRFELPGRNPGENNFPAREFADICLGCDSGTSRECTRSRGVVGDKPIKK